MGRRATVGGVLDRIRVAYLAGSEALNRRGAPFGVTRGQLQVLLALWPSDDCTQRELSERIFVKQSSVARVIAPLEDAGLIRRVTDARDHRKRLVRLTARGRELQAMIVPLAAEVEAAALQGLAESEVANLLRTLSQVAGNLAHRRRRRGADRSRRRFGV